VIDLIFHQGEGDAGEFTGEGIDGLDGARLSARRVATDVVSGLMVRNFTSVNGRCLRPTRFWRSGIGANKTRGWRGSCWSLLWSAEVRGR
jgi:hypothetical protein